MWWLQTAPKPTSEEALEQSWIHLPSIFILAFRVVLSLEATKSTNERCVWHLAVAKTDICAVFCRRECKEIKRQVQLILMRLCCGVGTFVCFGLCSLCVCYLPVSCSACLLGFCFCSFNFSLQLFHIWHTHTHRSYWGRFYSKLYHSQHLMGYYNILYSRRRVSRYKLFYFEVFFSSIQGETWKK